MNRHGAMNRIYRLVWSDHAGAWVAVAEIATGRGKRSSIVRAARRAAEGFAGATARLAALACLGVGASAAWAQGPVDGVVVGGAASVLQSDLRTDITQTTQRAIIDWRDFSISAGHTVQFHQPGSSSIALNRVTGEQMSLIDGSLLANGQVWLLNPNGIFVGAGGQISTRSFLGTTSSISNDDFMAGHYSFTRSTKPGGMLVNQGQITALAGGYAVLAGEAVRNNGVVSAELGQVVLAGGRSFAMDLQGDRLISFAVTTPVETLGADGKAVVLNTGALIANGGRVTLTARAAEDVVTSVINTGGLVQATSVRNEGGVIVLDAGDGRVEVAGVMDASGKASGQSGGAIDVLGGSVWLTAGSRLDVSGHSGGGSVRIGGDLLGQNAAVQNAKTVWLQQGASVDASGLVSGNGGRVIVWSDEQTVYSGSILAAGGAKSGDGGFVETSSKKQLVVTGRVLAHASQGRAGQWLLDPEDVSITSTESAAAPATEPAPESTTAAPAPVAAAEPTPESVAGGASIISAEAMSAALSDGTQVTLVSSGNVSVDSSVANTSDATSSSLSIQAAGTVSGTEQVSNTNVTVGNTTDPVAIAAALSGSSTDSTGATSSGAASTESSTTGGQQNEEQQAPSSATTTEAATSTTTAVSSATSGATASTTGATASATTAVASTASAGATITPPAPTLQVDAATLEKLATSGVGSLTVGSTSNTGTVTVEGNV
ncbi:MAG: hypothetical protein RIS59_733, partial [Pseudomonadota bacterium]